VNSVKTAACLFAVAGLATLSMAQGLVELEVSPAGAETWGSSLNALPGSSVDVRVKVSYTGTAQPVGLASMYMQPTISNWRTAGVADTVSPFVSTGSNISTPVGNVPDAVGQFGRIAPYANRATNGQQALASFVQTVSSTTYLRIAQSYATDWIGTGFNFSGDRGVPISQVNNTGRSPAEPAFSTALQNVVVFKYRINISTDVVGRVMQVTIPADGFGNQNTTTGAREIRWFANMTEATGSLVGGATVIPANIIVPAPAGLAMIGMGAMLAVKRRRK
jgi:hypothetical protein